VDAIRRTLFASDTLQIGAFAARPVSDACGDVERQGINVVVLPVSGVFSRHDSLGRHVTGTPSHAVLVAADTPYRLSFPGAIGDRALILRFGQAVALDRLDCHGGRQETASHGLLPAGAMMLCNLLWTRLARGEADAFEAEALGLDLLDISLNAMRGDSTPLRRSAHTRRTRAIERVKEVVALAPAANWNVAKLAKVASLSPFHLCHVFRQTVGTRSTTTCCRSVWPRRWTASSMAATTSRQSRWTPALPAIATSPRVSGGSLVAPRRRCGGWQQPRISPNYARS
jgi:AraC family transcriptional regulator